MKKILHLAICTLILITLGGCFSLSKKYVHRNQYALDVQTLHRKAPANSKVILEITDVLIAPQFSNSSFIYRKDKNYYLTDYYNTFMVPPEDQIKTLLSRYLNESGLFRYAGEEYGMGRPNYFLKAKILELYADYRQTDKPKGVMTMQFILVTRQDGKKKILMNKTIHRAVLLHSKDSKGLVQAWDGALTQIFRKLTFWLRPIVQ